MIGPGRLVPIIAGMLAAVLVVGGSAEASGTGGHASRPGSPPAVGQLSGVWCASSSDCVAVGGTDGAALTTSLAEQWNGRGWATMRAPLLNNGKDLSSVGCPRPNLCQAVGSVGAEKWNGTSWALEKMPRSVLAPTFTSVSCPAATFCMAVGERGFHSSGVTLAQTWNGSAWAPHDPVNPAGAVMAVLSSVSCVSSSDCLAVGTYEQPSQSLVALAESWNGTRWTLLTPPAGSSLSGVACASGPSCVAVGVNPPGTLALSWNGSVWTVLPAPPGTPAAIWCTAAPECVAVGGDSAESWNGSAWKSLRVPDASATLDSVSCAGASDCMAVGTAADVGSFAMSWNGRRWLARRVSQRDEFAGVWCALASRCMAAGSELAASSVPGMLTATWNGSSWKRSLAAVLAGSSLADVSCVSAADCMAVGGNGEQVLAARWNGGTWVITPTPAGPPGSSEDGVSCKGTRCLAVGRDLTAELWNGSKWRAETVPRPSPFYSGELTDVSCVTASYCLMTGFYYTDAQANSRSFAELWTGTKFRLLSPPGGGLNTVSCVSRSFCMALTGTAAEIWNGRTWRTAAKLRGSFGFGPGITAVSCASRSACMAVGNYLASGGPQGIEGFNVAQWWNGSSWRPLTPAGPGGGLADVSCTSPTRCIAVGLAPAGLVGDHTLAESWNGSRWRLLATPNP